MGHSDVISEIHVQKTIKVASKHKKRNNVPESEQKAKELYLKSHEMLKSRHKIPCLLKLFNLLSP